MYVPVVDLMVKQLRVHLTFTFYNLNSVHHLTICVANSPHLQNVCTHGSEFACRYAHFQVKFIFRNSMFCVGSMFFVNGYK